jgi:hypothetical protein
MAHGMEKFEAAKKPVAPQKYEVKMDAGKKKSKNVDPSSALAEAQKAQVLSEKEKALLAPIFANMAKKPEDLAKYKIKLPYKNYIDNSEYGKSELPADSDKRSPENAKLNQLLLAVQDLVTKKENRPILAGFISFKGEKPIGVSYCSGECSHSVEIRYGNETINEYGDYSDGKKEYSASDVENSPAKLKQLYLKDIVVLEKIVSILKRGFKFPEPKYMVVKTTPETKKNFGISFIESAGTIPPNALVKVLYTDPNNGNCYVIAKSRGAKGEVQGFVDGKLLEQYNVAKFHPEVSPVKRAFVGKSPDTEKNGGLNLRGLNGEIIGKIPFGIEMSILALESISGNFSMRALVTFKDPAHKGRLTTGYVVTAYLKVSG